MVNELLGIQYNIAKANVTDRKVQNLASYINVDSLRAIHKTMDKNKASGIDKVTKEKYEQSLEENLENLVKRMKTGSYRPNPTRRVYIPKETKGKMRPLGNPATRINWWRAQSHRYWSRFMNQSFTMRALGSDQTETVIRQ